MSREEGEINSKTPRHFDEIWQNAVQGLDEELLEVEKVISKLEVRVKKKDLRCEIERLFPQVCTQANESLEKILSTSTKLEILFQEFFTPQFFPSNEIRWKDEHFRYITEIESNVVNLQQEILSICKIYTRFEEFLHDKRSSERLHLTSKIEESLLQTKRKIKAKFLASFKFQLERFFSWPKAKHKISDSPFYSKSKPQIPLNLSHSSPIFFKILSLSSPLADLKHENENINNNKNDNINIINNNNNNNNNSKGVEGSKIVEMGNISNERLSETLFQSIIYYSIELQETFHINDNQQNNTKFINPSSNIIQQFKRYKELWILKSLLSPLILRFYYYFNNKNIVITEANKPQHAEGGGGGGGMKHQKSSPSNDDFGEKFEFLTSFLLNKIGDHSEFLLLTIQPVVQLLSANIIHHYNIKEEFIKNIIIILNQKSHSIFSHTALHHQTLFCNYLTSLSSFHRSLSSYHSYSPNTSIIVVDEHRISSDDNEIQPQRCRFTMPISPSCFDIFSPYYQPTRPYISSSSSNHFLSSAFIQILAAVMEEKVDEMYENGDSFTNYYTPEELIIDVDDYQPTICSYTFVELLLYLIDQSSLISNIESKHEFEEHVIRYLVDLFFHFLREKKKEAKSHLLYQIQNGNYNVQQVQITIQRFNKIGNSVNYSLVLFHENSPLFSLFIPKYEKLAKTCSLYSSHEYLNTIVEMR